MVKSLIDSWKKEWMGRASLVAQWLRIHLPMQETRVRALVREDPTCRGATKPVHHNYWARALEPLSHSYWSPCSWSLCSTTREATAVRSLRTTMKLAPLAATREKPARSNEDPMQPKINKYIYLKKKKKKKNEWGTSFWPDFMCKFYNKKFYNKNEVIFL